MHDTANQILVKHNVLKTNAEQLKSIIKEVLKVQNTFTCSSQLNTEAAINTMKKELEGSLSVSMSEEVGGVLDSMKGIFEDNFN